MVTITIWPLASYTNIKFRQKNETLGVTLLIWVGNIREK